MTRKIGVSLDDALYEWAAHEVGQGRAESVSALVADGLRALRGYAELADLIRDLEADGADLDTQTLARVESAERAAAAAHGEYLARKAQGGHAA
jgi:Arc/MetJ-type ribon-helix-helix transcriptional regulator